MFPPRSDNDLRGVDAREQRLLRAVGRRIAELRRAANQTQEEFAETYGASVKYIQAIELGRENLTLLSLDRLARALSVTAAELLAPPASLRANPGRPRRRE